MKAYRKVAKAYLTTNSGDLDPDLFRDEMPMQWSDPWLLLAIKTAQGSKARAELEDIVSAGDAINHAIFTHDELSGGFRRLRQAGMIGVNENVCHVTDAFNEAWIKAGAERFAFDRQWEIIRKFLGAPHWQPLQPPLQ